MVAFQARYLRNRITSSNPLLAFISPDPNENTPRAGGSIATLNHIANCPPAASTSGRPHHSRYRLSRVSTTLLKSIRSSSRNGAAVFEETLSPSACIELLEDHKIFDHLGVTSEPDPGPERAFSWSYQTGNGNRRVAVNRQYHYRRRGLVFWDWARLKAMDPAYLPRRDREQYPLWVQQFN